MPTKCSYGMGCDLDLKFDEAIEQAEALLKTKGFETYTRLNVHEIIGNACNDKFGRYLIVGACNPEFARQLFSADPNIGLLMPCNIAIYERLEGGCRVMIKDPVHIMDIIKSPLAIAAAINVKNRMEEIIEELSDTKGADP